MDPTQGQPSDLQQWTKDDFPHLTMEEWHAYERMVSTIGEGSVAHLLRTSSAEAQKQAAVAFMRNEEAMRSSQPATPATQRISRIKIDVTTYRGQENEPLLRWFVEVDTALNARQVVDEGQRVAFAISKLTGRARSWAFGRRLSDPNCFPTYESFKYELKQAFEPPKCEFRARAEFLNLRQGRDDIHAYAQRARYLVSSIVSDPIDSATQVVTFMKGLNDGVIKTYLFRQYPSTMEHAISMALQEDFSLKQARYQSNGVRSFRQFPRQATSGPEPMEVDAITEETSMPNRQRQVRKCFRCGKPGHFARNCRVNVSSRATNNGYRRQGSVDTSRRAQDGLRQPSRALVDTGASNNFIRATILEDMQHKCADFQEGNEMTIRLANGSIVKVPKRSMTLSLSFDGFQGTDEFLLIDLDERFDMILGMPRLRRYRPVIDWGRRRITVQDANKKSLLRLRQEERESVWLHAALEEDTETTNCDVNEDPASDGPASSTANHVDDNEIPLVDIQNNDFKIPDQDHAIIKLSTSEGNFKGHEISTERIRTLICNNKGRVVRVQDIGLERPPTDLKELLDLREMGVKEFKKSLRNGDIAQVCSVAIKNDYEEINTSSTLDVDVLEKSKRVERYETQSWEALKKSPVYELAREFQDIFPDAVPDELRSDRGVRHEIDLSDGTKYCVTRQWPLPREQVEAIDAFFEKRRKAGHVRESKSPHCSPTFCVKKATGGWRIVHAFNKLNDATIPAQTPVPRKDMIINGMAGSTMFSAIDLMDGFYQIRMREQDVPLTAVSTPSGMLWEWLVMPQGLKNAPATFNRMVTNLLRPLRAFAPSYFDDIFVHSSGTGNKSETDVHLSHLRQVFEVMRENKLYGNLKKCVFCAPEILVLGCYVGRNGVRADPEKVRAIDEWPTPTSVKQLRQWLGMANYLHKYTRNYAAMVQPITQLLKKDVPWNWTETQQAAFDQVKQKLREAPVLALPDDDRPYHVVCDASDFGIGCALMQHDKNGHERVIAYESRQLRAAERNYPVHDKELLAMKYALVKFRVHLLGEQQFVIYTDHASLRTAVKTPHLSQRMARWLSFFAEYNFVVHYKPGKSNILADALSRRPDYDPRQERQPSDNCTACATQEVNAVRVMGTSSLRQAIATAYRHDPSYNALLRFLSNSNESNGKDLPPRIRASLDRYYLEDGLLWYALDKTESGRIVVPNDSDLRDQIIYEHHDVPTGGHLGREKTFLAVSREFYWPHMYKWIRKYVRTCEICQRVKPSQASRAPLQLLPVPSDAWRSVSLDFVFGLPSDAQGRTGILTMVDRFSKMVHLAAVRAEITAEESAQTFLDTVFKLHGLPDELVSDRDPRFTAAIWREVFARLGTTLRMSTAAHPETDGQTERVNRVIEDILRSYATGFSEWSSFLPLVEFAVNNSTHASTGLTPFYINNGRHPRTAAALGGVAPTQSGGGSSPVHSNSTDATDAHAIDANFSPLSKSRPRDKEVMEDFLIQKPLYDSYEMLWLLHKTHKKSKPISKEEGMKKFSRLTTLYY